LQKTILNKIINYSYSKASENKRKKLNSSLFMRPETENSPRPVSARPLPRAWARGPAADGRAAETARAVRPLGLLLACLAGGRALTVGSNPTAGKHPQRNKSRDRPDLPETLRSFYSSLPVCHARASERRPWRPGEVGSTAAPPAGPLAGARAQPSGSAPPSSGLVVVHGPCAGSAWRTRPRARMCDVERRRPVLRHTPARGGGRERGRSPLPRVISILGSAG